MTLTSTATDQTLAGRCRVKGVLDIRRWPAPPSSGAEPLRLVKRGVTESFPQTGESRLSQRTPLRFLHVRRLQSTDKRPSCASGRGPRLLSSPQWHPNVDGNGAAGLRVWGKSPQHSAQTVDVFSDPAQALLWLPSCPPVYFLKRSRWCHGSDHRNARRVGAGSGEGQDPVFTGVMPA